MWQIKGEGAMGAHSSPQNLVQQGAAALRLWSGCDAIPVEAMRQAAREALNAA